MKPQQMVSAWTWLAGDTDGRKVGMVCEKEAARCHGDHVSSVWDRCESDCPSPKIIGASIGGWGRIGGWRR